MYTLCQFALVESIPKFKPYTQVPRQNCLYNEIVSLKIIRKRRRGGYV